MPTEWFNSGQVANALGVNQGNVQTNLPQIVEAMHQEGLTERPDMIAALATIGTEVPNFEPIPEWGSGWEYEGRGDLGNVYPGDGPRYKGRGFIQLTGRANYFHYGSVLGVDLINNPNLALDPHIGALVLARYFVERGTAGFARAGNWSEVRITVNGGLNGWSRFWGIVTVLMGLPIPDQQAPPPPPPPMPRLKVIHDTELRSHPDLAAVIKPVILLRNGTVVQKLGPWTPHWKMVRMSSGQVGWAYAQNLVAL